MKKYLDYYRKNNRSIHRRKHSGRQKPLITDWIQALSVLTGIAIWIWQYAIYDREQSQKRKEAVYQLVIAGQSEAIMSSAKSIAGKISTNTVELHDWDLRADLIPIHANLDAWAFCYMHELCDRNLVLDYTCKDAINFSNLSREMRKASSGIFFQQLNDPLEKLVLDCTDREAGTNRINRDTHNSPQ